MLGELEERRLDQPLALGLGQRVVWVGWDTDEPATTELAIDGDWTVWTDLATRREVTVTLPWVDSPVEFYVGATDALGNQSTWGPIHSFYDPVTDCL